MDDLELIFCQIIAQAGTAKSNYIEAMRCAREADFAKAESLINEANPAFMRAHEAHRELLVKEADGEKIPFSLLLMHAEDQLNSAEIFKTISEETLATMRTLLAKK
ncbi:PTS lactose/cellobiose transporter subunit IIA [Amygdalobacter nucleatus]|uniref:PTS lactose/cellobiose transporter subunit IIA n=1 Tax=Amygdalobacter nucleatus TaxID=3029274 RepID=UPI0027A37937|nr:PTS lactose/cellobiose transporter subunit IIA [Amygdalobacter nucleatus]WEG37418.1 PTS lactose/cellobiose transporter subunit IIA [Amygdalobacter nucleatus]